MAKTAAQGSAKWLANSQGAQPTWLANLQATTKPIAQAAVNQRAKMQARFAQATAPGGTWETHLLAVGDGGIKQAAAAKQTNYGTGIQQGASNQEKAMVKIMNFINGGLPAIEAAKASGADGKTIMNQWYDYMSSGHGQLGAK